jgi:hypothetical protein
MLDIDIVLGKFKLHDVSEFRCALDIAWTWKVSNTTHLSGLERTISITGQRKKF